MPQLNSKKFAFIGAGKMGETLIKGILDSGEVKTDQIIATALHEKQLARLRENLNIRTTLNNIEAVEAADVVLLCVKPQATEGVLAELSHVLKANQVVISIIASVTTTLIESKLYNKVPVVRAMPNTPSLVGAGMTAICGGKFTENRHIQLTENIFRLIGRTLVLDENYFDSVTGLSASGPAFIYIIIESMAEGGVKAGLPRDVATELAAQTCLGAAKMVIDTKQHPAVLKDNVTTPAGCTIDGILKLEEGGLRVTLIKAIVEAAKRASCLIND
ncbi:MAG: pyrroline-5-carboxylate reductase [Deferribacteres bacterium]|nr:pyrroline-5-carboxylate reductase [candidate division KSB1 bacterium]MCB9503357.1 pyrroline-5-carboxylate reductase [Deferribacteres bacterium]